MAPEPMNASPHHSKVKVSLTFADPIFVAGEHVSGKMEVECRAESGLGINIMMVELFAIQELTSRDHSATSTFLHSRRLFQGPGLPSSNAVQLYPLSGAPPLPPNYHQARRGISTFLFRFPIPASSPSSISFGSGLAAVRYEVRASVDVAWKGEKRLVTDKKVVQVVESFEEDFSRTEPEGVVVGENGKIWIQGRVVGGIVVAGESACVELQVKNHSTKKNTGLSISLTRTLHLPDVPMTKESPLQITDTLTTVAFRGPEYIILPGTEGVASLVFDVPKDANGVKGGIREGDEANGEITDPLFEVKCIIGVKLKMGIRSKDLQLDLPVTIVHPSAIPNLPPPDYPSPYLNASPVHAPPSMLPTPYIDRAQSPYGYPVPSTSPALPYIDQGHVWLPPPPIHTAHPYQHFSPPIDGQQYYFPPPLPPYFPPRPSSAGEFPRALPSAVGLPPPGMTLEFGDVQPVESEEGKGELALRVTQHLRLSSRHRSVSPQSHRYPLPVGSSASMAIPPPRVLRNLPIPPAPLDTSNLSISPVGSQGMVHSPRPFLSPKQSYSVDPLTHNSLPKSERVEELERMAAEVDVRSTNLSGDIPKVPESSLPAYVDKTLPGPPVPTGKDRFLGVRMRVDNAFFSPPPVPSQKAPPTPTLTAVTPVRHHPRSELNGSGRTESGLDALERKLLAEVGTRKLDPGDRRPDVREVLPIAIPAPSRALEPPNDSAISSLTLADHDHDSDERTHKAGKSTPSGDEKEAPWASSAKKEEKSSGRRQADRDSEKKSSGGRKKERNGDGEGRRYRHSAKGRVAAWLGGIDPDVLPPDMLPPPSPDFPVIGAVQSTSRSDPFVLKATPAIDTLRAEPSHEEKDVSSVPNPRSSGFVPIGTLKRDTLQRHSVDAKPGNPFAQTKRPTFAPPPWTPKTDGALGSPSSEPIRKVVAINGQASREAPPLPQKAIGRSPRFPPPPCPEVKYDIRSARGGRGGQVTAVASIWAAGATQSDNDVATKSKGAAQKLLAVPPPRSASKSPFQNRHAPSQQPRLLDLPGRQRPAVKSSSVPAISSSHATPTLSSTASLARPPAPTKTRAPIKVPPTVSETHTEAGKVRIAGVKAKSPPPGDLAFGQARLRDLIKKYQGQAT